MRFRRLHCKVGSYGRLHSRPCQWTNHVRKTAVFCNLSYSKGCADWLSAWIRRKPDRSERPSNRAMRDPVEVGVSNQCALPTGTCVRRLAAM